MQVLISDAADARSASPATLFLAQSRPSSPFPTPPASPLPSARSARNESWPHPSSVTVSSISVAASRESPLVGHKPRVLKERRRSLLNAKVTRFEVSLSDHLAEFLSGRKNRTLESICAASNVSGEIEGESGSRVFVCWGPSSSVSKCRQLVDARLSQTPLHILFGVRLASEDSSITFRLAQSLSATLISIPPSAPLSSLNAYYIVETSLSPTFATSIPAPSPDLNTPGSDLSDDSFFTHSSNGSGILTPSGTTDAIQRPALSFLSSAVSTESAIPRTQYSSLPRLGSFIALQEQYVSALVNELGACVARNSLVRLKAISGSQFFGLGSGSLGPLNCGGEGKSEAADFSESPRFSMDDLRRWKLDGKEPNLLSYFANALSESTAEQFKEKITKELGLRLKKQTSLVSIKHMDRQRATYARASLEVKGADIRDHQPGTSCSGTFALKKCSMLPSKPFLVSITTPTLEGQSLEEGTDMCLKILADKAATSPSYELSRAVQEASWDLYPGGTFQVHIELDPVRFTDSETEIRWIAKTRFEDQDYRATLCEVRPEGSKEHWFELELMSLALNRKLSEYVGARKMIDQREVAKLVRDFIEWCTNIVHPGSTGEKL